MSYDEHTVQCMPYSPSTLAFDVWQAWRPSVCRGCALSVQNALSLLLRSVRVWWRELQRLCLLATDGILSHSCASVRVSPAASDGKRLSDGIARWCVIVAVAAQMEYLTTMVCDLPPDPAPCPMRTDYLMYWESDVLGTLQCVLRVCEQLQRPGNCLRALLWSCAGADKRTAKLGSEPSQLGQDSQSERTACTRRVGGPSPLLVPGRSHARSAQAYPACDCIRRN